MILSRLGRRTGELATLLTERLREARTRTAAFLGSLLPGLDPMALRAAAGLLRDGVAGPARTLDGIHPDLTSALIQLATLPGRRDAIAELGRRTELAIGFKQLVPTGPEAWRNSPATSMAWRFRRLHAPSISSSPDAQLSPVDSSKRPQLHPGGEVAMAKIVIWVLESSALVLAFCCAGTATR